MDDITTAVRPEPDAPQHAAPGPSRFDADPEAVAWAREKIQRAVDRAAEFQRHAAADGNADMSARWRLTTSYMRRTLLGGKGCVIAAFDERLPEWVERLDRSEAPR